ncbi:MAG: RNA-binding protein, partial [Ruminococcaceae bacterium]|nr:RNA-binding protein [Oscillospiraceae bacterium]
MEFVIGRAVISKKGRDKGRVFIVTGYSDDYVLIADGKLRKVEKPKKKNKKHLQLTNTVFDIEVVNDNRLAYMSI